MKKLMTLMLGLSLVLGAATAFASDDKKDDMGKKSGKKKGGKKKGGDKKTEDKK